MVSRDQVLKMENLFSEYTITKVQADAAYATFQKEHEKIRDLLKKGETTGDQIKDWALSGNYPYQDRERSARRVYDYLKEHTGDYFFFLDCQQSYQIQSSWRFHAGKIAPSIFRYDAAVSRLSLVVEEGTLVEKDMTTYRHQSAMVLALPKEKNQLFIEGLILDPYHQKEGVLESTHAPFSEDDHHYVLGAGEKNVLSYLHKNKIIPQATRECLEKLVMRAPIAGEADPDSYWTT